MTDEFAQHRWAVLERARMLLDLGRPDEALGVVRPELAQDPTDPDLLALTARAERAAADEARAVAGGAAPAPPAADRPQEGQDPARRRWAPWRRRRCRVWWRRRR